MSLVAFIVLSPFVRVVLFYSAFCEAGDHGAFYRRLWKPCRQLPARPELGFEVYEIMTPVIVPRLAAKRTSGVSDGFALGVATINASSDDKAESE
jgi:hypothetical protein